MRLMFECAGKEVDIAEERNRIANQPPDKGKPSIPDQRAQDRQGAEEKPVDPTITDDGVHSQPQVAYNRSFENKGSKHGNNAAPMNGRKLG